jgi:hypothetical protein
LLLASFYPAWLHVASLAVLRNYSSPKGPVPSSFFLGVCKKVHKFLKQASFSMVVRYTCNPSTQEA